MKKTVKKTSALAAALALGLVFPSASFAAKFQDMPKEDEWSYKALDYCLKKEYL